MDDKMKKLYDEIKVCMDEAGKKREYYDKCVTWCNRVYPLFSGMSVIAITIIPSGTAAWFWKAVAVASVVAASFFTKMVKADGYGEKLLQRSITYFSLCDLSREIRLEEKPEQNYVKYRNEFEEIMKMDNKRGLYTSFRIVNILDSNMEKTLKEEELLKKGGKDE